LDAWSLSRAVSGKVFNGFKGKRRLSVEEKIAELERETAIGLQRLVKYALVPQNLREAGDDLQVDTVTQTFFA